MVKHIADPNVSEFQTGFRVNCDTTDCIFVARQLQEKCKEQAFDMVNREALWTLLEKQGSPANFVSIIRDFHDGMCERVSAGGKLSDPFNVTNGVKQGCILAPLLFVLFYAAMLNEAMSKTVAIIYTQKSNSYFMAIVIFPYPSPIILRDIFKSNKIQKRALKMNERNRTGTIHLNFRI